jgi:ComF family protein
MITVDTWLHRARTNLLATLWPPQCVLCSRRGQLASFDLCAGCEGDLPSNINHCEICAEPFQTEHAGPRWCGACVRRHPRLDISRIPFRYAYPMDHMVRRLKYGGAIAIGRVLGELFSQRLACEEQPWPEVLIPVPLAQQRFRKRGFNQAIVLAEHIHRATNLTLRTDLLVRTRETLEQAGLDQRARRKNIRRAFEITGKPPKHVAIIDDVVTTGSTVNEVARVLKRAGAERVEVWAIAKAEKAR